MTAGPCVGTSGDSATLFAGTNVSPLVHFTTRNRETNVLTSMAAMG